jgi:NDP-sugar pyrophosphorylase family protein
MPIGDRAILEVVVDQLEDHGITDITFCVGYLAHLIRTVFDNRANGHVKISYVHEQEALGTAGPIRLIEGLDESFIVMNGDVLTNIDYADLLRHHRQSGNALTIATRQRAIKIDYGVLHVDDDGTSSRIVRFVEKPEHQSTVSMGIYVFEPPILEYVPLGRHYDFPELVQALLAHDQQVGAYRFDGAWFDIGREDDNARAMEEWERGVLNGTPANGQANGVPTERHAAPERI